jgi:hypothetical protein
LTYETSNSIKGWVALIAGGIGFLFCISAQAPGQMLQDRAIAVAILLVGVCMGISWTRGRMGIRNMKAQSRNLRKRLALMSEHIPRV